MSQDTLLALVSFASVMSFTPGPNNILLTTSGVNFGFVRSIPHILGVKFGFVALLAACGLGLGLLFATYPAAQTTLKVAGALYMLWLAWKVANANSATGTAAGPRPISFLQAAVFQWVNPKGIVAAVSAIALFVRPDTALTDFLLLIFIFGLFTITGDLHLDRFWRGAQHMAAGSAPCAVFNVAMALLLVASIVPMVL